MYKYYIFTACVLVFLRKRCYNQADMKNLVDGGLKMKRITAVFLFAVILMASLCACGNKNNNDINYVLSFSSEDGSSKWSCEMKEEGIITAEETVLDEEDGSVSYIYVLESVGEGETDISFVCTDIKSGETVKTVNYSVKVGADYKINVSLLSDTVPETRPAVTEIGSKGEAEEYIKDVIASSDADNADKYVYETEKAQDGRYRVRVFIEKTDDSGKTVVEYVRTYYVSSDADIETKTEHSVDDRPVTSK